MRLLFMLKPSSGWILSSMKNITKRKLQIKMENSITETLDIFLGYDDSQTYVPEKDLLNFDDTSQDQPSISTDTTLRYSDLGLLGRGGMGEVRKVRDNI